MERNFHDKYLCCPIYKFLCTVISYQFYDSKTSQYTPIFICYMISLFQLLLHCFFQNAITWPELNFIFNIYSKYITSAHQTSILDGVGYFGERRKRGFGYQYLDGARGDNQSQVLQDKYPE